MGEGREGIASSSENNGLRSCREAHDVAGLPQEDRGGAKGEMGEVQGGAEAGCVKSWRKTRTR